MDGSMDASMDGSMSGWTDGRMDVEKKCTLKRKEDMSISFKILPQTCLVFSLSVTAELKLRRLKIGIS